MRGVHIGGPSQKAHCRTTFHTFDHMPSDFVLPDRSMPLLVPVWCIVELIIAFFSDSSNAMLVCSRGAYPSPLNYCQFPKSCCTSLNEIVCHGIPDSTVRLHLAYTTYRD
jgi:hypothetical protein